MKFFITFCLFFIFSNSFAQLSSYEESRIPIRTTFDMAFSLNESDVYILSALDNYEITTNVFVKKEREEEVLQKAIKRAECSSCELIKEIVSDSPLDYLFENIEEGDVFAIYKLENKYKLKHYR